jgi:hypothetical protein
VVEVAAGARDVRAALPSVDVVVVPAALAAWSGVDRIPAAQRRQAGWLLLGQARDRPADGWDAVLPAAPPPAELRTGVYAAANTARLRRGDDGPAVSPN